MSGSAETPDILTLEQAAELLRLSTKTVAKLARSGKLPGRQISGRASPWRFVRRELLVWCHGDRAA